MKLHGIFTIRLPLAFVTRRYAWAIPIIVTLGLVSTALEGIGIWADRSLATDIGQPHWRTHEQPRR